MLSTVFESLFFLLLRYFNFAIGWIVMVKKQTTISCCIVVQSQSRAYFLSDSHPTAHPHTHTRKWNEMRRLHMRIIIFLVSMSMADILISYYRCLLYWWYHMDQNCIVWNSRRELHATIILWKCDPSFLLCLIAVRYPIDCKLIRNNFL